METAGLRVSVEVSVDLSRQAGDPHIGIILKKHGLCLEGDSQVVFWRREPPRDRFGETHSGRGIRSLILFRPVHLNITMIKWIRTSRLSIR